MFKSDIININFNIFKIHFKSFFFHSFLFLSSPHAVSETWLPLLAVRCACVGAYVRPDLSKLYLINAVKVTKLFGINVYHDCVSGTTWSAV